MSKDRVKVQAKKIVYVNHRRYFPGDVFFVKESQVSKNNMVRLDGKAPVAPIEPEPEMSYDDHDDDDGDVI